jgi:MFS family permease
LIPTNGATETTAASARARRLSVAVMLALVAAAGLTFGLVVPILSLRLEQDGVATWVIGLNGSMALLAALLVGPLIPALLVRAGALGAIIAGSALVAAGFLLLPTFPSVEAWFPIRFMVGCGMTLLWVVSLTWLNAAVGEARRGLVMGLNAALFGGGYALGPLIVTQTGIDSRLPFDLAAAIIGIAAALLVSVRRVAPRLEISHTRPLGQLHAVLLAAPVVLAAAFASGFGESGAGALIPVYSLRSGLSLEQSVITVAALTLGGVLLQFPIGWLADRIERGRLLLVLSALGLAGPIALPFATAAPAALYALLFLWGGAVLGLYAVALTLLGKRFAGAPLLHANALFVMAYSLGSVAGSTGTGAAMALWDPHGLVALLAAVFLILLGYAVLRHRRRNATVPTA